MSTTSFLCFGPNGDGYPSLQTEGVAQPVEHQTSKSGGRWFESNLTPFPKYLSEAKVLAGPKVDDYLVKAGSTPVPSTIHGRAGK